jgi:hypothetical protein
MKNLQSWRIDNNINFIFCVEYVMTVIDSEHRSDLSVIFEKLNEIFDRITAISSFSFIDLKKKMKEKYIESIRINNTFSSIFRRLKNSEAK